MGLVTDTLLKLLRRQIEAHRTLVWCDPERAYLDLALSLTPEQVAGAAVHRYEPKRGFLWMRRDLDAAHRFGGIEQWVAVAEKARRLAICSQDQA